MICDPIKPTGMRWNECSGALCRRTASAVIDCLDCYEHMRVKLQTCMTKCGNRHVMPFLKTIMKPMKHEYINWYDEIAAHRAVGLPSQTNKALCRGSSFQGFKHAVQGAIWGWCSFCKTCASLAALSAAAAASLLLPTTSRRWLKVSSPFTVLSKPSVCQGRPCLQKTRLHMGIGRSPKGA